VGRAGKSDRAIQALVVGQRHAGQPQLDRALHKILDARRAIEEREVGVAMQLSESTWHWAIIERLF
jgi:hypothetical protein